MNDKEEVPEEYSPPNYQQNINLTPSSQKEVNWDDTINDIKNKAIEKEEDNVLLPIYRYAKLLPLMQYHLATIIHES